MSFSILKGRFWGDTQTPWLGDILIPKIRNGGPIDSNGSAIVGFAAYLCLLCGTIAQRLD